MSARRSLTRGIGELLRLLDPGLSDLVRTPQKQEQLEEARRQYEAKQRMQREHQAAITAQMRLAEQERAAQRARDYAARAAQDSDKTSKGGQYPRSTPTACRNCQLQHQRLDADGYCYREVCIRSRAKRMARTEKA